MSKTFKSKGIVLKSLKYSETSLILDIYTRDKGLRSFIISGVRKAKAKQANIFQAMNIIDLVAQDKQEKLARIKESKLSVIYSSLNQEVLKSSIGIYYVDLFRAVVKEKESNPELFDFLETALINLDQSHSELALKPLVFGINMAKHLGFGWSNNFSEIDNCFDIQIGQFVPFSSNHQSSLNPELSKTLYEILLQGSSVTVSKPVRTELMNALIRYFSFHIEGFTELRSLKVLRAILA